MKALTTILAGLTICCLLAQPLQAQTPVIVPASSVYGHPGPHAWSAGYAHHHPGWWGPRYHASTAAESYMRGVAAMTRARGEYNLMTAQAHVHAQQAQSMALDNHKKGVETYFAVRKVNRDARESERRPRPTQEELVRLARTAAPDRLEAEQLPAADGRIAWPESLQGDEYAGYRARIEQIFAERASIGGLGPEDRRLVSQATTAMRMLLKRQIREMSPMEYTNARRFLDGLAYEVQLAAS